MSTRHLHMFQGFAGFLVGRPYPESESGTATRSPRTRLRETRRWFGEREGASVHALAFSLSSSFDCSLAPAGPRRPARISRNPAATASRISAATSSRANWPHSTSFRLSAGSLVVWRAHPCPPSPGTAVTGFSRTLANGSLPPRDAMLSAQLATRRVWSPVEGNDL